MNTPIQLYKYWLTQTETLKEKELSLFGTRIDAGNAQSKLVKFLLGNNLKREGVYSIVLVDEEDKVIRLEITIDQAGTEHIKELKEKP